MSLEEDEEGYTKEFYDPFEEKLITGIVFEKCEGLLPYNLQQRRLKM